MPYVYPEVDKLQGSEKVGSKQCVALLQYYAKVPHHSAWKERGAVFGDFTIPKGTAIATFINGRYRSLPTGNHAAFYISQDAGGIWIMDQWASERRKPFVSKRYIRKKGTWKNGQFVDPSNNAEAYSVIE